LRDGVVKGDADGWLLRLLVHTGDDTARLGSKFPFTTR